MTSRHIPRVRPGLTVAAPSNVLQRACSCGGKGRRLRGMQEEARGAASALGGGFACGGRRPAARARRPALPRRSARAGRAPSTSRIGSATTSAACGCIPMRRLRESAQMVNALAYTVGRDVVFGRDSTSRTRPGRRLLAHELTHVAQQPHVTEPPASLRVGDSQQRRRSTKPSASPAACAAKAWRPLDRQPSNGSLFNRKTRGQGTSGLRSRNCRCRRRFSVGKKNGKWYWRMDRIPGLGSTGDIPADPRDIPEKIRDLFEEETGWRRRRTMASKLFQCRGLRIRPSRRTGSQPSAFGSRGIQSVAWRRRSSRPRRRLL